MRPGLTSHFKFGRLVRRLGAPYMAAGVLELLWARCYELGDDYAGSAEDMAYAVGWTDDPETLADALEQSGFVDQMPDQPGHYRVHDLWDHAPDYVQRRAVREQARRSKGESLSDVRSRAGKQGADAKINNLQANDQQVAGKRPSFASHLPDSDRHLPASDRHLLVTDQQTAANDGQVPTGLLANVSTPAPAPSTDQDQDQKHFQAQPVENSGRAAERTSTRPSGREPPRLVSKPTNGQPVQASWRAYLKLAHAVLDDRQDGDLEADDSAAFKTHCSRARLAYNGRVAGQALDAARHMRATAAKAPREGMGGP